MKISLVVGSLALLTPGLVAQVTVRSALNADGNYGLFASQGATSNHRAIPAGQAIPSSATLSVGIPGTGSLDTVLGWRQRGNVVSVDISEQGAVSVAPGARPFRGGSTASAMGAVVRPSAHSLMLRIAGRPGTAGLLEAWASGVTGDGVDVKYGVDVHNDGRVDFGASPPRGSSRIIPVKIPSTGVLMVKLTSNVIVARGAGTSARYKTGLSVRFTPGPHCAVRVYGESCGPRLTGRFVPASSGGGGFLLSASNGTANGRGLMMLGLRELRIPIPGSRCPLLNEARWVVPIRFNAAGANTWGFRIPAGLAGDVKLQIADLSRGVIRASNGVQVVCL